MHIAGIACVLLLSDRLVYQHIGQELTEFFLHLFDVLPALCFLKPNQVLNVLLEAVGLTNLKQAVRKLMYLRARSEEGPFLEIRLVTWRSEHVEALVRHVLDGLSERLNQVMK